MTCKMTMTDGEVIVFNRNWVCMPITDGSIKVQRQFGDVTVTKVYTAVMFTVVEFSR